MGGHDEREQTLNQLLAEMDGFDSSKGVIIMAATNRPEVLDPALLRPGRFDRQVVVDKPDVRGREAILRLHARERDAGARRRSRASSPPARPGIAGADLANIVNEAALLAARKGKNAVEMADFEEAIDRVVGRTREARAACSPRRSATSSPITRSATRSWPSSLPHADPVHKVTIIPRGVAALGVTYQLPIEDRYLLTRSELEDRIAVLLGGRVAEELVYGEVSTGAHNDLERATEMARLMVTQVRDVGALGLATFGGAGTPLFLKGAGAWRGERDYSDETARSIDEEIRAILDRIYDRVRGLLTTKKAVLIIAAGELKQRETLEGERLRRLLAGESDGGVAMISCSCSAADAFVERSSLALARAGAWGAFAASRTAERRRSPLLVAGARAVQAPVLPVQMPLTAGSFAQVAETVKPAVININTVTRGGGGGPHADRGVLRRRVLPSLLRRRAGARARSAASAPASSSIRPASRSPTPTWSSRPPRSRSSTPTARSTRPRSSGVDKKTDLAVLQARRRQGTFPSATPRRLRPDAGRRLGAGRRLAVRPPADGDRRHHQRQRGARSARAPSTTSCRPTPPSIRATPAGRS